ncbi:sulfotransferase [bacterium]|nr:sulfotransferase [bacterium]
MSAEELIIETHEHNVILTGTPRSGTSLLCRLLNKLSGVVALDEPLSKRSTRLPIRSREEMRIDALTLCEEVEFFFTRTRHSILTRGEAMSRQSDGQLLDNAFGEDSAKTGLRKRQGRRDYITINKRLAHDFLLCAKAPAPFTAILEHLVERFQCFALIRNPLAVLASWNSINRPLSDGHSPSVERLDIQVRRALAMIHDKFDRQLYLLSWFYEKYDALLPKEAILRYEKMISSGGRSLEAITEKADNLHENLESRNENRLYDRELMDVLGEKLLLSDGFYWKFYTRESVEVLLSDVCLSHSRDESHGS